MIIRTGSQKTALIVFAHQTPASFNATARDVAVQELSDQGYRVLVSDLYAMKFRAEATRDDIKGELKNPELFQYGDETMFAWMENQLSEDITAEQQKVTEAELIIFQFPLYWFSVPAILKGWFDRVLAQGFAFSLEKMYDNGVFKTGLDRFRLVWTGSDWFGLNFGLVLDNLYFSFRLISFRPVVD
uniref:Flavodoxin-like fold domain-containing protein n=1 Tax=Acanthochromis polyacanthus TaxID=80966 RepID=A0A3Q1EGU6_9TELE